MAPAVNLNNIHQIRGDLEALFEQDTTEPDASSVEATALSSPSSSTVRESYPTSADALAQKVQQVQATIEKGPQVILAYQTEEASGRILLNNPNQIRLSEAGVEVNLGQDDLGQDRWVVVSDFQEQADREIEQAISRYQQRSPTPSAPVGSEAEQSPQVSDDPLSESLSRVGRWNEQRGQAAKYAGKFLNDAGLAEAVMADGEFSRKIENEPFLALNVERHGGDLHFYHTGIQNGDAFIDSEVVFNLSEDGRLQVKETAVNGFFGEGRMQDRGFAGLMMANINKQGFAEAARQSQQPASAEQDESSSLHPSAHARIPSSGQMPLHEMTSVEVVKQIFEVAQAYLQAGGQLDIGPLGQPKMLNSPEQIRFQESGQVEHFVGQGKGPGGRQWSIVSPNTLDSWAEVLQVPGPMDYAQAVSEKLFSRHLLAVPRPVRSPGQDNAAPVSLESAESDLTQGPQLAEREGEIAVPEQADSHGEETHHLDYADVLNSLRATADQLPAEQRSEVIEAIERLETQRQGSQPDEPGQLGDSVPAESFIQQSIETARS